MYIMNTNYVTPIESESESARMIPCLAMTLGFLVYSEAYGGVNTAIVFNHFYLVWTEM